MPRDRIAALAIALASTEAQPGGKGAWVHLIPAGTVTGRDGRGPYHLRDAEAVIAESRRKAGRVQIPVDYNHASVIRKTDPQPVPAAGWITGMQARADGIWGLVEWTPRAARHIAEREYRYLSPVFAHTKDGDVRAILGAGLVQEPNLDMLTALASAEWDDMNEPTFPTQLREILGLDAEATDEDVIGAVRALTTASHATAPDPARFVPIGDFQRVSHELHAIKAGTAAETAERKVAEAMRAGKLPPAMKGWGLALCGSDPAAFDAYITNMPAIVTPGSSDLGKRPAERGARVLSDEQLAIAARLGVDADKLATNLQD